MLDKATDKIGNASLNRLEHDILSLLQNFTCPLYSIYVDMTRDLEGVDISLLWFTLGKLLDSGYIKASRVADGRTQVTQLTDKDLKKYIEGRSEEDLRNYPFGTEYEFTITDMGRNEESKDIYDAYYPEE